MADKTPEQEARRLIEKAGQTGAEELHLKGLGLAALPPEIGGLQNLRQLNLTNNQLTALPREIGRLQNLDNLDLKDNQLTALAAEIGQCESLRWLNLIGNRLTALPAEIGQLQNLQYLYLDRNHLTALAAEISQARFLRVLQLRGNQLTALPSEIGRLQNLAWLYLEANQLTTLPPEISQLQNLQGLALSDNPLPEPYPELIERGKDAVLSYLRSLAKDSTAQYEAKLLLVGEGNVGKTSLVTAMMAEPAKREEVFEENRDTTHGINLGQLKLDHPSGDEAKRIALNTWDFGGQDVYRITHQFFFSKRSLYLLVWWPREGQEAGDVEGWLKRIRLRVPDARVILVSTHADERRPPEIDYAGLNRRFPDMLAGRHAVDTKSGTGIDDLLRTVVAEAAQLPQMGEKMSRYWVEARDEALAKDEPQIGRTDFGAIAASHELDDTAAETLLNLLHDLGRIVYYGDDEGLRDVVVIKPEWLTKAIGYVLADEPTAESKGELRHSRLRGIWYDHNEPTFERYEPACHPFFLRLMEKFDISYRFPGEEASLVGQLVPHERPELPWDAESEMPKNWRRFAVICSMDDGPPGIVAWLTVRNHKYVWQRLHWRRGVFVSHRGQEGYRATEPHGASAHRSRSLAGASVGPVEGQPFYPDTPALGRTDPRVARALSRHKEERRPVRFPVWVGGLARTSR